MFADRSCQGVFAFHGSTHGCSCLVAGGDIKATDSPCLYAAIGSSTLADQRPFDLVSMSDPNRRIDTAGLFMLGLLLRHFTTLQDLMSML